MSANSIRRSDDNIEERYKKIADAISKNNVSSKFAEFGKVASLNESDSSSMPVFTSNYINFSNFEEKAKEEQRVASLENNHLKERAAKRRIIAGIDDIDLDEYDDSEDIDIDEILKEYEDGDDDDDDPILCPKCGSMNCTVLPTVPELKKLKIKVCKCKDCGKQFTVGEKIKFDKSKEDYVDPAIEKDLPFAFNKSPKRIRHKDILDENEHYDSRRLPFEFNKKSKRISYKETFDESNSDIISSIKSMLPEVVAKPNKKMNKMAGTIVKNLIGLLDIEQNKKQWLNAQIDSGVLNSDIFMRNIKTALQNGGK